MSINEVKQPSGALAYLMAHSLSTSFLGINGTFSNMISWDIFIYRPHLLNFPYSMLVYCGKFVYTRENCSNSKDTVMIYFAQSIDLMNRIEVYMWFRGLFIYLVSLITGLAFGVFRRVSNQKKVNGIIIDIEQNHRNQEGRITHTAIIKYIVNNKEYITKTIYQSSSFYRGGKVIVYYNSDNPNDSFVRSGIAIYLFVYLLILIGTIIFAKDILYYLCKG